MTVVKTLRLSATIWLLASTCQVSLAEVTTRTVGDLGSGSAIVDANAQDQANPARLHTGANANPLVDLQDVAAEASSAPDLLSPMETSASLVGPKLLDAEQATDLRKDIAASWMAGRSSLGVGAANGGTNQLETHKASAALLQVHAPAADHDQDPEQAVSRIKPLLDFFRDNRYALLSVSAALLTIIWAYSLLFSRSARTGKSRRGKSRRNPRKMPAVLVPAKEHRHRSTSHSRRRSSSRSAERRGRSADRAADTSGG